MLLAFYHLQDIIPSAGMEKTVLDIGTGLSKDCLNQSKTLKQYEEDSKYCYMQEDHHMNHGSYQKQQMKAILWVHRKSWWLFTLWEKKGCRKFMRCHKLHSVISPSILQRFPRSQSQLKALKKTFRSMPVTSRGDQ